MDEHAYRRFYFRTVDADAREKLRATLGARGLREGTHYRFDATSLHFHNPLTDLSDPTTRAYVNGALYEAKAIPA